MANTKPDASQITYTATGGVLRTQADKNAESVSVFDFMTPAQIADVQSGTLLLDVTVPVQTALTYVSTTTPRKKLHAPSGLYKLTDTLRVRNPVSGHSGGWSLEGDGFSTVFYQTGAGKNVLEIGAYDPGGTVPVEGITIENIALLGTNGTNYALYLNEVARSFFSNLWVCGVEADIAVKGCLLNKWDGISVGYAAFNENPQVGITIPTTRKRGIIALPGSLNSYTTNAWSAVEIVGHSVGALTVDGGSTNTYVNLTIEGESGYGILSSSEWDSYNGLYFENSTLTGSLITLLNTQKNTFTNIFDGNLKTITLTNASGCNFIGCRTGTYAFDATSINGTLISSTGAVTAAAPAATPAMIYAGSPEAISFYNTQLTGTTTAGIVNAGVTSVTSLNGRKHASAALTDVPFGTTKTVTIPLAGMSADEFIFTLSGTNGATGQAAILKLSICGFVGDPSYYNVTEMARFAGAGVTISAVTKNATTVTFTVQSTSGSASITLKYQTNGTVAPVATIA